MLYLKLKKLLDNFFLSSSETAIVGGDRSILLWYGCDTAGRLSPDSLYANTRKR